MLKKSLLKTSLLPWNNRIKITAVFLAGLLFCPSPYLRLAQAENAGYVPPVSANPPLPSADTGSGKIKVEAYQVELGKAIEIPVFGLVRSINSEQNVAEILSQTTDHITVQGLNIGSTLLFLWETAGVRSLRVVVVRPYEEVELQERLELQGSSLFKQQKKKRFSFFYETQSGLFRKGEVLPRAEEKRKYLGHKFRFQGGTPWGLLLGKAEYEYRKDATSQKAIAMPRDFQLGLYDSTAGPVQGYDLVGGSDFIRVNDLGFPGVRLEGMSLKRSTVYRNESLSRGFYPFLFVGQERDGSLTDNPAGFQNRKLKDKMAGQVLDYFWARDKRVRFGSFQRWSGPKNEQAEKNFTADYDLNFSHLGLSGEVGWDDQSRFSMQFNTDVYSDWLTIRNRWSNIGKDYQTVTGTVAGQGKLGYEMQAVFLPLWLLWAYEKLQLRFSMNFLRNRISPNPLRMKHYNRLFLTSLSCSLPANIFFETVAGYDDARSNSFPTLGRSWEARLSKDFYFDSRWLKRFRIYTHSKIDTYRKGIESPGFNADRYQIQSGTDITLFESVFLRAEFLQVRLDEIEFVDPEARTYPSQIILEAGYAAQIAETPLSVNLSVRYTDERHTFNKTHQPLTQQDRLEGRAGLTYRFSQKNSAYIEAQATVIESIVGQKPQAEFTLVGGMRMGWDSPLYIPEKGKIEGYFFKDLNGNGHMDPGEPGLSGFEIGADEGPSTKTNSEGYYHLKILEGKVRLRASGKIPEGYFFTTSSHGAFDLYPRETKRIDFGITAQLRVRGRAFMDMNLNQFYDEGDIPMSAVRISLDSGQKVMTTAQGQFALLRIMPGPNRLSIDLDSVPEGYKTLTPVEKKFDGSPGDIIAYDILFEARRFVGGLVYEDLNGDGFHSEDEPVLSDIRLKLNDETTQTDQKGRYYFKNLKPGNYLLSVDAGSLPQGYRSVTATQVLEVHAEPYLASNRNFAVTKTPDNRKS